MPTVKSSSFIDQIHSKSVFTLVKLVKPIVNYPLHTLYHLYGWYKPSILVVSDIATSPFRRAAVSARAGARAAQVSHGTTGWDLAHLEQSLRRLCTTCRLEKEKIGCCELSVPWWVSWLSGDFEGANAEITYIVISEGYISQLLSR